MNRRRWLYRLASALLLSLLALGGVELLLRAAGTGYDPSFLVEYQTPGGDTALTHNLDYGRLYFPGTQARTPEPCLLAPDKPPDTFRVLVLGGSAAAGDPLSDYGLSRMLERLLNARYAGLNAEVINAAMTAVNSHVVYQLAHELLPRLEPDVVVLYLGNNEVVGPFGPATRFLKFRNRLPMIRMSIRLRKTRIGQAIVALQESLSGERNAKWQGLGAFVETRLSVGDSRLPMVYDHLERNLADILRLCERQESAVVLCTVPVNLADHAPFGSAHRDELSPGQRKQWENDHTAATSLQDQAEYKSAAALLQRVLSLDDQYAESWFRLGQCRAALGEGPEAREAFLRARDLDVLRFRADTAINDRIRAVASAGTSSALHLLDLEQRFLNEQSGPAPGDAYFVDHVHLTFDGNYRVARWIGEALENEVAKPPGTEALPRWPTVEECRSRLAFTPWDEALLFELVYLRRLRAPWTLQFNHAEDLLRREEQLVARKATHTSDLLQACLDTYSAAIADAPGDWVLKYRAAQLLSSLGRDEPAFELLQQVIAILPHLAEPYHDLAKLHVRADRFDEAAALLKDAALRHPLKAPYVSYRIGQFCMGEGKLDAGIEHLEQALEAGYDEPAASMLLGTALMQRGKNDTAISHFRNAVREAPGQADARFLLGNALLQTGNTEEALRWLNEAAETDPGHVASRRVLANHYLRTGNAKDALPHAERVVALAPLEAEARLVLAELLEQEGEPAAAGHHAGRAVLLAPDDATVQYKGGNLIAGSGDMTRALECFLRAAELRTNWIPPANNAAWILATTRDPELVDPDRAVGLAKRCDTLARHRSPEILDTLGAAYAAAGRYEVAIRMVDDALVMAEEQGKGQLVESLRSRRALYSEERRYIRE